MTDRLVSNLTEAMAALPFVEWDRTAGNEDGRVVFGWLPRSDGKRDFVTLTAWAGWGDHVAAVTSSAKHSRTIARALGHEAGHQDCQPVGAVFGEVPA